MSLPSKIAFLSFIIAFTAYFPFMYGKNKIKKFISKYTDENSTEVLSLGIDKWAGFIAMFVFPILLFKYFSPESLRDFYHTNSQNNLPNWIFILCIVAAITLNFFIAGKKANHDIYPQMRLNQWNILHWVFYIFGWSIYLFAYEFLFRGILFFIPFYDFSLVMLIAINCILYAFAHLPKGKKEIIASLPFGVILCLLTLYADGFWPAFWLHFTLAVSNSIFAFRGNPNMILKWK